MNYKVDGNFYTAGDGFAFISKKIGFVSKVLVLKDPRMFDYYDIIPEPIPEPIPEEPEQEETNG